MAKAPIIVRTRTVLTRYIAEDYKDVTVGFDTPAAEEGEQPRYTRLDLDRGVWDEMGRPEQVTVTVEPGVHWASGPEVNGG